MKIFGTIVLVFICLISSSLADKNAYEMLKAAEKGETDKVLQLIKEKGVLITTKNNFGVR